MPLGQYRLDDAGTYELAGNSIRFDETDKNKFTYKNRDRDIMGFALLQPPKPAPAIASKPLPDVVTPGYLPPNEEQRKRKPEPPVSTSTAEVAAVSPDKTMPPTPTKTAAETGKQLPKPVVEPPRSQPTVPPAPQVATNKPAESSKPPVVEATKPVTTKPAVDPPKPVDKPVVEPPKAVGVTVRQAEPTKPAPDMPKLSADKPAQLPVISSVEKPAALAPSKADVPRVAEQEKLTKPIIQKPVALSVSPALKKALTSEQQRIVAGMRLRGWMQVIGGLAALGGSYVAYSGLKKDYDAYSQKVNALNTEYNLYRDLSRREIPPPA